jgi:signal transduction histidine kinase/ligand-binding sensor domain-containing protein/CheY-like chemotaxis protein/AraC-like DNA-binding protein
MRTLPVISALVLFVLNALSLFAQSSLSYSLTIREGLADNSVYATIQDSRGFMWFGTWKGLCSYDTKRFKTYKNDPENPRSISSDFIRSTYSDSRGALWIGTNWGLNRYDAPTDSFDRFFHDASNPNSLTDNTILCISEDRQDNLWLGTRNGLNRVSLSNEGATIQRYLYTSSSAEQKAEVSAIYEAPDGVLWLLVNNEIVRLDLTLDDPKLKPIAAKNLPSLAGSNFLSICADPEGNLWVGHRDLGLGHFDTKTERFRFFKNNSSDTQKKTEHLVIEKIIRTKKEILWMKTNLGLLSFDPSTQTFINHLRNNPGTDKFANEGILDVYADQQDNLWVGTYADGVRYFTPQVDFFVTLIPDGTPLAIQQVLQGSNGQIWFQAYGNDHLGKRHSTWFHFNKASNWLTRGPMVDGDCSRSYFDRKGTLWLGLFSNVLVNYRVVDGKLQELNRYQLPPVTSNNGDWITAFSEDQAGMVVGTANNGLYAFDEQNDRFSPLPLSKISDGVDDDHITFLLNDSNGNLWVATSFGVRMINRSSNKTLRFQTANAVQESASTRTVNCIHEDNAGRIWMILSNDGLYLFDPEKDRFLAKNQSPDILGYNITNLQHDDRGYLWLSNELGLVEYNIEKNTTRQFLYNEGIPGSRIMSNSALKAEDGSIFITTNSGAFHFHPDKIPFNQTRPPVVFSELRLFNKPVTLGDQTGILKTKLSEAEEITFRHDQSIFSIDFAVLNFTHPEKNQYAFKLDGLEDNWNYVDNPTATYTNLPSGRYTLLVKGANNDGTWNENGSKLSIVVQPPWWNTWYAWLTYLVFAAILIYYVSRFLWLKSTLEREKELQEVKLNFFTNISHEIRTRLMLISGPVEQLLESEEEKEEDKKLLGYIRSSSDSLLNLVNELMDFRKMEGGITRFVIAEYDIISFSKNVMAAFEHLAEAKNIRMRFYSDLSSLRLWFDPEQLQKVLYNLLTNAFKFTNDGGEISLHIKESKNSATIEVCDNGIGIAPEHLGKLFDNYFQVDESRGQNTGYGVGLALSKGIIEKLKGSLTVTSTPQKPGINGRTVFTITLQKGKEHFPAELFNTPEKEEANELNSFRPTSSMGATESKKAPTILLAEDNEDLRNFVSDALGAHYSIISTRNGKEAWQVCNELLPDLVVSDVMMAEMNGLQLCTRIKADIRTSHIPVILLTAKTAIPNQLEGLESGADLYLTKPLSLQVLELNIRNLLASRSLMQEKYSRQISLSDHSIHLGRTKDDEFLNSLTKFVEENIDNSEVGVPELCRHVGMSKTVLYKKLRALTDLTINDFVKIIRFKVAARLLKEERLSVQQVASFVGYEDRKHFSREFKKHFGKTPSDYASQEF